MIDINTKNIINKFRGVMEAEAKTGVDHSCIINVCKGRQKRAGKFGWCYL